MSPSEADLVLRAGGYEAAVSPIGATLRALTHDGRDLVWSFPAGSPRPAMSGALLAPWPNRLADGAYTHDGRDHRLPLTEPERGTALHGLVADAVFAVERHTDATLVLRGTIPVTPGYPWPVDLEVRFDLDGTHGLTETVIAVNLGDAPAPFGVGGHPSLLGGPPDDGAVDGWTLLVPAASVMLVDPVRLLPLAVEPVSRHPELDVRTGRAIGAAAINNAYADLDRDAVGRARVEVRGPDGRGAALTLDAACRWVQVYTGDEPIDGRSRSAVAVEPMTCPPDAFRSGVDLIDLAPGEPRSASWTLSALS